MLRTERCDKGKQNKIRTVSHLANPGHRYYILYLFIIYTHRYIKCARALTRHRSLGDFSTDIRVKSGGDRGGRYRALLSVTRARVIFGYPVATDITDRREELRTD